MTTYRNPKLLALAKHAPRCFCCGQDNDGTVVAAHSNEGKGMGIKASDALIAYMCHKCHSVIDNGNTLSRQERRAAMNEAIVKTYQWMMENGRITINENR